MVADEYDAARPSYPAEVFDALEPFGGLRVLDVRTCPGTNRGQRDIEWGATIGTVRRFVVGGRITIPWTSDVTIDTWMTDLASRSYVVGLADDERERLLTNLRRIVHGPFPDGSMAVPYETWLWIATRN